MVDQRNPDRGFRQQLTAPEAERNVISHMPPFTLIARFEAKPGHQQRLADALAAMTAPSLAEEGCLAYQPYVDPSRPTRMIIVEEWAGQAALDEHFRTPHFRHVAALLDDLLAEPFTLTRFERTEIGHGGPT